MVGLSWGIIKDAIFNLCHIVIISKSHAKGGTHADSICFQIHVAILIAEEAICGAYDCGVRDA